MKAITPRQQDRRDRILDCTRQQVARLGYDGLNMRDLAVEADVSTATIYNLFKSKDDLILAASHQFRANISDGLNGSVRGLARLLARLEATADAIAVNPRYADAMGRMLFAAESSAPIVDTLIAETRDRVSRELKEMQQDGDLVEKIDVDRLSRDIAGVHWSVILLWMKGFIAQQDFKDDYVGAVLGALLPWLTAAVAESYRLKTGIPL